MLQFCESLTEQSELAFMREEAASEMNFEILGWSGDSFAIQGAVRGQGNSRELGSCILPAEHIHRFASCADQRG